MVDIRFVTDEELAEYRWAVTFGFGYEDDPSKPSERKARWLAARTPGTQIAGFDHGRAVSTFASFDFDLTVPGETVPMAGTTQVTVQPTHRRQGLLTQMMRMHLEQAIEREQPLAGLWASEERIYGRFGYGVATSAYGADLSGRVDLPRGPADVTVRFVTAEEAREVLPPVYEQVRPRIVGALSRTPEWWDYKPLGDNEEDRDGAGRLRFAVAEQAGTSVGYVTHRLKEGWEHEGPDGTVQIRELMAINDDARRALWHFVTNVDLFPKVKWWNMPLDEPVRIEADWFRSIKCTVSDAMWLRLLDVSRALEARRYERDGTITLGVDDGFLDRGGIFALEVADGEAMCKPTSGDADVQLSISDLGSLYLGGGSAITLARAGRLAGTPESVRALDHLFGTLTPPYCPEVF